MPALDSLDLRQKALGIDFDFNLSFSHSSEWG